MTTKENTTNTNAMSTNNENTRKYNNIDISDEYYNTVVFFNKENLPRYYKKVSEEYSKSNINILKLAPKHISDKLYNIIKCFIAVMGKSFMTQLSEQINSIYEYIEHPNSIYIIQQHYRDCNNFEEFVDEFKDSIRYSIESTIDFLVPLDFDTPRGIYTFNEAYDTITSLKSRLNSKYDGLRKGEDPDEIKAFLKENKLYLYPSSDDLQELTKEFIYELFDIKEFYPSLEELWRKIYTK